MSNTYINIRFGSFHLKWERGMYYPYVSFNAYHDELRDTDPNWKWFEIY